MVQIPKFWCLTPSTNIYPSCGNTHLIKKVIKKELQRQETFKTFNYRPYFCIKNHILAHNSKWGPWTDLMPHIFGIHMSSGFRIGMAPVWDRNFLLLASLPSVKWWPEYDRMSDHLITQNNKQFLLNSNTFLASHK